MALPSPGCGARSTRPQRPAEVLLPAARRPQEQIRLQFKHFRALWRRGEAMVVELGTDTLEAQWTPKDFVTTLDHVPCKVVSNRSGEIFDSSVGAFFATFGKTMEGSDRCKIKVCFLFFFPPFDFRRTALNLGSRRQDWPSSSDFKESYPDLFNDLGPITSLPISRTA